MTTLTLKEITKSYDSSGMPTVAVGATVQTLAGYFQPTTSKEKETWSKVGVIAEYRFYIDKAKFTSSANEAKLLEGNILASSSVNYNIIGIDNQTDAPIGKHYKVYLQELK